MRSKHKENKKVALGRFNSYSYPHNYFLAQQSLP